MPGDGDLGHLKRDVTAMADDLRTDLLIGFSFRLVIDQSLIGSGVATCVTSSLFTNPRNSGTPTRWLNTSSLCLTAGAVDGSVESASPNCEILFTTTLSRARSITTKYSSMQLAAMLSRS